MSLIRCLHCEREAEGFAASPLPGNWGAELLAHTCPPCFQDWMAQEIMIINEYRLDLSLTKNQDLLNQEMARFLKLPSSDGQAAAGAPSGATPQA